MKSMNGFVQKSIHFSQKTLPILKTVFFCKISDFCDFSEQI